MGCSVSTGSLGQAPENAVHVPAAPACSDSVSGNALSGGEGSFNGLDSPLTSSRSSPLSSSRGRRRRSVMSDEAYNNVLEHTGLYNSANGRSRLPSWAGSVRDLSLGERESSGNLVRGGTASLADIVGGEIHSHLLPPPSSPHLLTSAASSSSSSYLSHAATSTGTRHTHVLSPLPHREQKMASPLDPAGGGLTCLTQTAFPGGSHPAGHVAFAHLHDQVLSPACTILKSS